MQFFIEVFIFFTFGAIFGSFLNVVILRFNTGSTLLDRSGCFSCGTTLSVVELIPILSFLAQKGRCKKCESKIFCQYPIVEFVSGVLLVLISFKSGLIGNLSINLLLPTLFYYIIFAVLLVVSVYDLKHKIIPDFFVYIFITFSFLIAIARHLGFENVIATGTFIQDILVGPFFALLFGGFWYFSGGRLMGFGDAKLVLGIGFLLGASKTITAVLVSFWSGAIIGVLLLLLKGKYFNMKSEIPFAPFLVLGAVFAFFSSISFF